MKKINLMIFGISIIAMNCPLSASELQQDVEIVRYRFCGVGPDAEFPFQVEGLFGKEPELTWTDGKKVSITIPPMFENKRCKRLVFKDFLTHTNTTLSQAVEILVNGRLSRKYNYNLKTPAPMIDIPLPFDLTQPTVITFNLPNACDPKNGDPRKLALALRTVEISYDLPHQQVINFGTDSLAPVTMTKGASSPEGSHRWLTEHETTLRVPQALDDKIITQITLHDVSALLSPTHAQRLIVSGVGIDRQAYDFNTETPSHNVTIKLPLNHKGDLDLKLETPNACYTSFADHPVGDPRKLSMLLRTATITYFIAPKKRPLPPSPVAKDAAKSVAKAAPKAVAKAPAKPVAKPAQPEADNARDKLKNALFAAAQRAQQMQDRFDFNHKASEPKTNFDNNVIGEDEWGDDVAPNVTPAPQALQQELIKEPLRTPKKLNLKPSAGGILDQIKAQRKEYAEVTPSIPMPSANRQPVEQNGKTEVADASTSVATAFKNMLHNQRLQAFSDDDDIESDFDD